MIGQYFEFVLSRQEDILRAMQDHLVISAVSVLLGAIVAIPIGIWLAGNRSSWLNGIIFSIANILQTIPSLALLAILIPLLGVGRTPAIFALFLYSLMPILRNTYSGFQSVDPNLLEAARGMGYSRKQQLLQIQLPLALPYIMSGIRVTTVYIISWATLATLIGAGGLGQLIFAGMGTNRKELIFTGAILAVILALAADLFLSLAEKRVTANTHSANAIGRGGNQ
ncbi:MULTISPECIES: ABC transporter permease [unclassified Paenibacillus]|uniref:ABC transporter permease n=1 Tax=unclassified Paenibacillus TaxID=185978 RepID=UPI001AE39AD9|nr:MULTISPECIES: ABC transporter permease [unclassified Paenibacillus]MBP1155796.1 osmoprotectant transport system permease protein [Paenibacillus sp. PvP091]MBP1168818.1 osmoprotectant transport system permease protein [Paenibacillus sp. PvR098]MBP2439846.1 osmoprotectant transport system permease protein [Paenibacillus sp. PvP052]